MSATGATISPRVQLREINKSPGGKAGKINQHSPPRAAPPAGGRAGRGLAAPAGLSPEARTRWCWRHADAVCFDVDSTVCEDEAIDELADYCGVGEEVAAWTKKAMNGNFSFRQALSERLDLIRPSAAQLEAFLRQNPPRLTQGIREVVAELQRGGTAVYLVSGGFKTIIRPAARALRVPESNIFANVLLFDENGAFAGFDEGQPTSESGGKPAVCRLLKQKHNYQRLVMVGDGATDLEASPPADAFIGFGGNQVRERVKNESSWFVYDFKDLLEELRKPSADDAED